MCAAVPRAGIVGFAAALSVACGSAGDPPPRGESYFPTALALSGDADRDGDPDHLFIANSNFDLRYSSGTVQAIDLAAADQVIQRCERLVDEYADARAACREACFAFDAGALPASGDAGVDPCLRCTERETCDERADAGATREEACDACFELCDDEHEALLAAIPYDDGKCVLDPTPKSRLFAGEVRIGSFATALAPSADGTRLFVTTRNDDRLTVVPLADGAAGSLVLACDENGVGCPVGSTRPKDADDALPDWPGDPTHLVTGPMSDWAGAGADGDYVLVAHRRAAVSLLVSTPGASAADFVLADTTERFPAALASTVQLTGMARDPVSGLVHATLIATFGGGAEYGIALGRLGVRVPSEGRTHAALYDAGLLRLDGVAGQETSRALTFVDAVDGANPAVSGPRALVVAESPAALLFVNTNTSDDEPQAGRVSRVTEVGEGATHVVAGTLGTPGAADSLRVALVSCFDSREVFVVDLTTGLARSVVRNLSGPFELALDGTRKRLYVADFRSSVVRVLDLAPVVRAGAEGDTTARLVATIGRPRVVQELQ